MVWTNTPEPSAPTWSNDTESKIGAAVTGAPIGLLLTLTYSVTNISWANATKPSSPTWTEDSEPS
jgi:hypothetical protein